MTGLQRYYFSPLSIVTRFPLTLSPPVIRYRAKLNIFVTTRGSDIRAQGWPDWGTCWETIVGGNHFRAWKQDGPLDRTGAWFLAYVVPTSPLVPILIPFFPPPWSHPPWYRPHSSYPIHRTDQAAYLLSTHSSSTTPSFQTDMISAGTCSSPAQYKETYRSTHHHTTFKAYQDMYGGRTSPGNAGC